jgi:GNAT superfamily N-acetyltransferase
VRIRRAHSGHAEAFRALALRSKGHWGYDAAFLELCRPELTLTESDLGRLVVRVAERDGELVGMSALDVEADPPRLDMLFVEPAAIGTGVGGDLYADACEQARARGLRALLVASDPNAEPFYLSRGAVRVGEDTSASTGRALPLLRADLGS